MVIFYHITFLLLGKELSWQGSNMNGCKSNPSCSNMMYWGIQKKLTCLAGYGMKIMWLIFKTKIFLCQSKASLDDKIMFWKSLIFRTQKFGKFLERGLYGNRESYFPFWSIIYSLLAVKYHFRN